MASLLAPWMLDEQFATHRSFDKSISSQEDHTAPQGSSDDCETKRKVFDEIDRLQLSMLKDEESSTSIAGLDMFRRPRMSADERRARHREAQREFAVRKKHQLDEMRRLVQTTERQLAYLEQTKEIASLKADNAKLELQYQALDRLVFSDVEKHIRCSE